MVFARYQAYFMTDRRESQVGVVLAQQDAVLCARGKHAVGFVDAFGYQVVDQYADVGFVALQYDRLQPLQCPMRIDAGHQTLGCGFLIAGRAVYLAGKVEAAHQLRFERMMQLRRRKVIIFNSIAGAEDVDVFQTADFVQRFQLDFPGQRRREAVEVIFVGAATFGFEEKLMLFLVGKGAELVLDAGTVARSDALDRAVEKRRTVESAAQNGMHLGRGVDHETRKLVLNGMRVGRKGKFGRMFVALLHFQCLEVDRTSVQSGRSAGLHAPDFEA